MALHLKSTGIDFSDFGNLGGKASELLDDYEAGTFTPAMNAGAINVGDVAGHYIHIGKLVKCKTMFNCGGSGDGQTTALITGLPYTSDGGNYNYGHICVLTDQLDHAYGNVQGQVAPGGTSCALVVNSHIVNAHSGLTLDHFTSSSDVRASINYISA